MNEKEKLQKVKQRLEASGYDHARLSEHCDCTSKAIYDVFNGLVTGRSRVKDRLTLLLTREELEMLGWEESPIIKEIEENNEVAEKRRQLLVERVRKLESKVKE